LSVRDRARVEALALGVLALGAALYAGTTWEALSEPEIVNYSEGIVLHAAERTLLGGPLYGDLREAPFHYSAYPPLFPVVAGWLLDVTGVRLAVLRALAAVAYAVALGIAGRIASRESGHAWAGWCATGLGLGVASAHPFAAIARVDALEIALGLVALERLLAIERGETRRPYLAAVAAVAALCGCALTKWTGLAPFAGLALHRAWVTRSPRDPVLVVTGAGVLVTVAAYALGHVLTSGALTRQLFVDQAQSGVIVRGFVTLNFVSYQLGILVVAGWAAARGVARSTVAALVASVLWMSISQLKDGADHNYSLGPIALAIAVAGAGLPPLLEDFRRTRATRPALAEPALGLFALISMGLASLQTSHLEERGPRWRSDHVALHAALAALPPGAIVLAEEPFYARVHGLAPWLSDPCHVQILARHGALSPEPHLAALRAGTIPWVLRGDVLGGVPGLDEVLAAHFEEVLRTEGPLTTGPLTLHRHRDVTRREPGGRAR
jgi:hypothetical protein